MDELVIFGVCAFPFALIVFGMFLRRKTHCWECGGALTQAEMVSGSANPVIACRRCSTSAGTAGVLVAGKTSDGGM